MPASNKKQEKGGTKSDEGQNVLKGVYMFANGDKYDGEYIQKMSGGLQRSGCGEHVTAEGLVYNGDWKKDKMNGTGKLSHPSGAVYEGEFVNNMFHGYGKYTWPDGSVYEGNFCDNKVEGQGQFTDVNGQVWVGNFTHHAAPGLKFKLNL
ncbi:MORN repeat-containing protein 2 [Exaiptasia diaphana]|uniref:MORN repeat-containing protein 2 n=1 Tax=Exaiptasia diaphana TaxID=2652724 RepID=A0A913Y1X2_EXADI|nr:MORN repeat-containing protein 2 [Exaiptasia diaphana]KXJ23409.1 MORN repeat-containing protein 2 [Exaiptasia diaphana]